MNRKTLKRLAAGLLCLAFVLTAAPFAPRKTAKADDDRCIVVSLGDSFASGEGNEPFFGQEITDIRQRQKNTQAWEDWLAHRSMIAWSARLCVNEESTGFPVPVQRGKNWFFAAASGAVTENIVKTPYNSDRVRQIHPGEQKKEYDRDGVFGTYYLPGQLNIFDSGLFDPEDVDFVTVSIGGNDVGFTKVLELAVRNGLFSSDLYEDINKKLRHFYDPGSTHDDILDAYLRIHAAAPNATIIVVGYPGLLSLDSTVGCPLFNLNEREYIDGAVTEFNKRLRLLVEECRDGYGVDIVFCSVEEAFFGHEAYSILYEPFINPIYFGKKSQDLLENIRLKGENKDVISFYSMHPNNAGLAAYAECVQKKINDPWSDLNNSQQDDQILTSDLWAAIDLSGFRRYFGMSYSSIEGMMGPLKSVEVEYEIGMLYSFLFGNAPLQFSFVTDLYDALLETDDDAFGSIPAEIAKRYLDGTEQCNGICIPSLSLTGFRGTVNAKDIGAEYFRDEEYEDLWLAEVTRNGLHYEFICDDRYGNISEYEPCWITIPSIREGAAGMLWYLIDCSDVTDYLGKEYKTIRSKAGALRSAGWGGDYMVDRFDFYGLPGYSFRFDADFSDAQADGLDLFFDTYSGDVVEKYLTGEEPCIGIMVWGLSDLGFTGRFNAVDIGGEITMASNTENDWCVHVTRGEYHYMFHCDANGWVGGNSWCSITKSAYDAETGGDQTPGGYTLFGDLTGNDACYLDTINDFAQRYEQNFGDMGYDVTVTDAYYCLRDLNGDGVNELVLSTDGYNIDALYTRNGQNVVELYFQGRHGSLGVTSDGYVYEDYKGIRMYKLYRTQLIELYAIDRDGSWEELERLDHAERDRRGIGKTDMAFDFRKYL